MVDDASFFPPVPVGTPWEDVDTPAPIFPAWAHPRYDVRPGVTGLSVELGRSDSTVVLIEGARVHPDGVVLRLAVRFRERSRELRRRLFAELEVTLGRGQLNCLPPGGLRWGVQFADGGRATTLDDSPWNELPDGAFEAGWAPDHPVLQGLGRPAGEGATWSRNYWLWPLPPVGALRFVCLWPDRGIDETSVAIDTAALRAAAAAARPEWLEN